MSALVPPRYVEPLVYVENHVDTSRDNHHSFHGYTEEAYKDNPEAGGAVRSILMSGSYGEFKRVRVDSEVNSETISTSWSASVGENLRVGNAAAIDGYLQIAVSDNLIPGASEKETAVVATTKTCGDLENVRLHVGGNAVFDNTASIQEVVTPNLSADRVSTPELTASHAVVVFLTASHAQLENLVATSASTFESNARFQQDVYIDGNLYVTGSETHLNVDELYIEDKTITVASGSTAPEQAQGAGLIIQAGESDEDNIHFTYDAPTDSMILDRNFSASAVQTPNIVAESGSISDLTSDHANISDFTGSFISASSITGSFYGDGTHIANITASIASSSTYRQFLNIAAGESQDVVHPFKTTDVFVQVYKWKDPEFTPVMPSGSETYPPDQTFSSPATLVNDAQIQIIDTSSVRISYPEELHGYAVVADAGMLITGSGYLEIVECTTDICRYDVEIPVDDDYVVENFKHKLGTENVIVTVYQDQDILNNQHDIRPVQIYPEQIAVLDENNVQVVFKRPNDEEGLIGLTGYVVIAKAGHVVKQSQIDESWLTSHSVHYGVDGDWEANSYRVNKFSTDEASAESYVDTPRIGNLNTGEQYYQDYTDDYGKTTQLWGSYTEYTDTGIISHVRDKGVPVDSEEEWNPDEDYETVPAVSLLDSKGDLYLKGGLITNHVFGTSDIRLKENIKPLENALEGVEQLRGVRFNWKDSGQQDIGVIAQEVQTIYPELTKFVEKDLDGNSRLVVNYQGLVGVLLEAVKELSTRVKELEIQVKSNENR